MPARFRGSEVAAWVTAVSTAALCLVTAGLALYAKHNLDALLASNRQSARFFELEAMPWLTVRLDQIRSDTIGDSLRMAIVVRNTGKSAASDLSVIFQRRWARQGSIYASRVYESIPWREQTKDLVPAGDIWQGGPQCVWPAGDAHTSRDTTFLHICCFYTGALSGRRYYFERVAQLCNYQQVRLGTRRAWNADIVYTDAYIGEVVNDTVKLRTGMLDTPSQLP